MTPISAPAGSMSPCLARGHIHATTSAVPSPHIAARIHTQPLRLRLMSQHHAVREALSCEGEQSWLSLPRFEQPVLTGNYLTAERLAQNLGEDPEREMRRRIIDQALEASARMDRRRHRRRTTATDQAEGEEEAHHGVLVAADQLRAARA
ncbi:hypothetical protein [Streptomyces sp. NPDC018972]|uniref:hypothetical protein n=1 Tax=Streptomyces sp. NPDC018972 TaxID=3365060 RepID=UPI00379E99C3